MSGGEEGGEGSTARKTSVHKSFQVWKLWSFPAVPKFGNEPSFQVTTSTSNS